MNQDELKRAVALAAAHYVTQHLPLGGVLGVGTGSTANLFIEQLATIKNQIGAAVASSKVTAERLSRQGIKVVDLNNVAQMSLYVDGADEIDANFNMIKGGGGALTREKIVAAVADTFVCICDVSKQVSVLGKFPLPIEVIPMARAQIMRQLKNLAGEPILREGFISDNGNEIIDLHGLQITHPTDLEQQLNQIPGIVTNGLFAQRGADVLLLGTADGVLTKLKPK